MESSAARQVNALDVWLLLILHSLPGARAKVQTLVKKMCRGPSSQHQHQHEYSSTRPNMSESHSETRVLEYPFSTLFPIQKGTQGYKDAPRPFFVPRSVRRALLNAAGQARVALALRQGHLRAACGPRQEERALRSGLNTVPAGRTKGALHAKPGAPREVRPAPTPAVSTKILGKSMRGAVRNKERW